MTERLRRARGAVIERLRRRVRRARYRRMLRRMAGPKLLAALATALPRATFVEIGANDGEQHDHLRPYILATEWSGLMVEPVPYVFERLRRNYGHLERVRLVNAAVAGEDGTVAFHHLAPPEGDAEPEWYDGIGSLSRDVVLAHAARFPGVRDRVVTSEVPALTYPSLLARNGVERVDLLVIDTEGLDWQILRGVDLTRDPPWLILFEHYHLDPDDRAAAHAHLRAHGFETMEEGFDTFAARPGLDALDRVWRRARPAVAGVAAYEDPAWQ